MKSLIILCVLAVSCAQASAAEIAIALIDDRVEVDANFAGADVTLFGAVTGVEENADAYDIVATIAGPRGDFLVRPLEQRGIIWLPGEPHRIENAPRFFLSSATRPIKDVAPLPDQAMFELDVDNIAAIDLYADGKSEHPFNAALLDALEGAGQYADDIGGVAFLKGALFTINAALPANTPVGEYAVNVYLYRDGVLLGRDATALQVNKVGLERRIYDLAHGRPVLYGLLCVAVSLLAGWIAGLAFRKS